MIQELDLRISERHQGKGVRKRWAKNTKQKQKCVLWYTKYWDKGKELIQCTVHKLGRSWIRRDEKMQNEGKRRRKNSILTVLDKAEFIMLRDLEMSLGKGMVFCF